MKFLLEQKRIVEYESADLRCSGSSAHGIACYVETTDDRSKDQSTTYGQSRQLRCIIHSSNNHSTSDCRVYDKLPEQMVQFIKDKRACYSCLKIGHRSSNCKLHKKCPEDGCNMFYYPSLHSAYIQGINFHTTTSAMSNKDYHSCTRLLQLMKIKSGTKNFKSLNVLWDRGATLNLITFEKARELELRGKEIKISVVKVGGQKEEIYSFVYLLLNEKAEVVMLQVYGIHRISRNVQQINLTEVIGLFQGLNTKKVKRSSQAAIGMLQSSEERLLRNKAHADMYKDQIQDMVDRGVHRKLSESEIKEYDGPIHYISHHEVLKSDSTSTPCRIVFNSSAKFHGHSLNDY